MQEPIQLKMTVIVTDGNDDIVADDTFIRSNLSYQNLVMIQGILLGVGNELQRIAEDKAGMTSEPDEPLTDKKRKK